MDKTIRNLIIFAVATLGGGFLGIAIEKVAPSPDPMQSAGAGAGVWLIPALFIPVFALHFQI